MKQLLLIRHAKSAWDQLGLSDHDRPLNQRGERDAPQMAAALKQRGIIPDRIVSSSALRAHRTAKVIGESLGYSSEGIEVSSALYLASASQIVRLIQQLDESIKTVMLFGHNPGMHEAANFLCDTAFIDEFPTLAVARFEIADDYWGTIDRGSGILLESLTPRILRES